jgi:hypothetical protein
LFDCDKSGYSTRRTLFARILTVDLQQDGS